MSDQAKHSEDQTTRRDLFCTLGKVAAGLAAVVVGERFATGNAFAAAIGKHSSAQAIPMSSPYCCYGAQACGTPSCPTGTSPGYQWLCCIGPGHTVLCTDCYKDGHLVCIAAEVFSGGNC